MTMRISSRGYVALVVLAVVELLTIAEFGPAVPSAISPGQQISIEPRRGRVCRLQFVGLLEALIG